MRSPSSGVHGLFIGGPKTRLGTCHALRGSRGLGCLAGGDLCIAATQVGSEGGSRPSLPGRKPSFSVLPRPAGAAPGRLNCPSPLPLPLLTARVRESILAAGASHARRSSCSWWPARSAVTAAPASAGLNLIVNSPVDAPDRNARAGERARTVVAVGRFCSQSEFLRWELWRQLSRRMRLQLRRRTASTAPPIRRT